MPINWFDRTIYIPWEIGIPIIAVIFAVAFFAVYAVSRKNAEKYYACPNCGYRFKTTALRLLFTAHVNNDQLLKCPNCGKTDYCSPSYD